MLVVTNFVDLRVETVFISFLCVLVGASLQIFIPFCLYCLVSLGLGASLLLLHHLEPDVAQLHSVVEVHLTTSPPKVSALFGRALLCLARR